MTPCPFTSKECRTWFEVLRLLEEAGEWRNVYLETNDAEDMVLIIGGIIMQPLHNDLKLRPEKKETMDVDEQEALLQETSSMLMCCDIEYPVRLAVLHKFAGDEDGESIWQKIKQEFLIDKRRTKAKVVEELPNNVHVFRAPAIVFDGTVPHAGMPVQNYSRASDSSPIKLLEHRVKRKRRVDLRFLKSIAKLNTITRIFLSTWPKDKHGEKSEFIVEGAVDTILPRP